MKATRASVARVAKERGLEPLDIDGILEGFAWKEQDIRIGEKDHRGVFVAFVPLSEMVEVRSNMEEVLVKLYNEYKK